ncbi:MAG TPA: sigma 54-interacting transcriptional regulator [Bryobacteraceae bacterium]
MSPAVSARETGPANSQLASRYEALIRLAEAIRSHPERGDLFQAFVNGLHRVVRFDAIAQFDGTALVHWHFCEPYNKDLDAFRSSVGADEETVVGWVYRNQQPVVLRFSDRDGRFPYLEPVWRLGMRSVCALPLSTAHRQLGSLIFASHLEDAYSAEEQKFLHLVANQIALALDDARAQERLQLLLDLTNRVVSKLDLRELLQEITESVRQVMQGDGVGVALPDPETGQLRLYAFDHPGRDEKKKDEPMLECIESAFRRGKCVNLSKEEIACEPKLLDAGHKSLCLLPLKSRGRVLGVFGVAEARENAFTEDDLSFLGRIADQIALAVDNALAYQEISQLKDRLSQEKVYLESEIRSELGFEDIVGKSEALRRVLSEIETVAPADSTVLIYGETGTGKELIARAVHNLSSRKANAFVKLNCAAIPTGLLESELFGHERGAFTGAITQRVGRFELAHRGTMFLDEIGEVPLDLQPKLLRVLQEREFERLGSTRTMKTDARLIAATNRDLKAMVDEQRFRSDLYYRLNVFPIAVPALRERPEDIPLLVRHFVQQFSQRNNRAIDTIPSETMEALVHYSWPGNIRELQNVIERAVIVTKGPVLSVPVADLKAADLKAADLKSNGSAKPVPAQRERLQDMPQHERLQDTLDETERGEILRALEQSNWVVAGPSGAATRLGMKRSTLQVRMQKLGIRLSRTAIRDGRN